MRTPPRKRAEKGRCNRRLNGEVLDAAAVKAFLGAESEGIVYARAKRGLLPHRRWGGRLVFLKSEILQFLAALPGVTAAEALANVQARRKET